MSLRSGLTQSGFMVAGALRSDGVRLFASSDIRDINMQTSLSELSSVDFFMRPYRTHEEECRFAARVRHHVTVQGDSWAGAWSKLLELWQPPEPVHLATALVLGKKP